MKKRMGRPPIDPQDARAVLVSLRFTRSEAKMILAAARREKLTKSQWARKCLLQRAACATDSTANGME